MKPAHLNLLVYLALIALAAEVVFLVIQNRRLQAQIVALTRSPETLKKGEKVESVNLVSISGAKEELSFGADAPHRLLYVFNTRCPACQKTLPVWKQLAAEMPTLIQVMGIANDSLSAITNYQKEHALNYPIFVVADTLFKSKYKISLVPQTMLLDGSGTVLDLWSGVLQDSRLVEIRKTINQDMKLSNMAPMEGTSYHERR
jgi:peroxiredoxin